MHYNITLFTSKEDNWPKPKTIRWEDMIRKASRPAVRAQKDGQLMSGSIFAEDEELGRPRRLKELAIECSILFGDIDHNARFDQVGMAMGSLALQSLLYTTYSHRLKGEDRLRVVLPLAAPIPARKYNLIWDWFQEQLGGLLDTACQDVSRMVYTPAISTEDAPYRWRSLEGELLDWRDLDLSRFEPKPPAPRPIETRQIDGWEDLRRELVARIAGHETARRNRRGKIDCRGICHNGNSKTGLFADPHSNRITCTAGCDLRTILRAFGLPDRPQQSNAYVRLGRGVGDRAVKIPTIKR